MPNLDATGIDTAVRKFEPYMQEAWDVRRHDWLSLGQRKLMPNVPAAVQDAAKQIPVLSPLLEDNLSADVQIITQNDSKVEVIDQEGTQDSEADCEDVRIWLEIQKNRANHGKLLDQAIATRLVWPDGVAVVRMEAIRPDEPELDDDDDTYAHARDKYFKNANHECYKFHVVNLYTTAWGPKYLDKEFTDFVEVCEVDAFFADDYKRRSDGKTVRNILKDKGVHLSAGRVQDESVSNSSEADTFKITFYETKDVEENCWYRYEYVCGASGNLKDDGEFLDRIKLPHKRSSYFVIPSGTSNFTETSNPHRMFRPKLYSLGVLVQDLNTWKTMRSGIVYALNTNKSVYARVPANVSEDGRRLIENLAPGIFSFDGAGADTTLVIDLPDRTGNQLLVTGGLELRSWPGMVEVLQAIDKAIEEINAEIQNYRTNPYLTGRAFAEYREGTGTAASLATQGAAVPYGAHRTSIDTFWESACDAMVNCIQSWEEDAEIERPYYGIATGQEAKAEAGQAVKLTYEKASRRKTIKVSTLVETQGERQVRVTEARVAFDRKELTLEELLAAEGHDDPHKYAQKIAEESYLADAQVKMQPMMDARMMVLVDGLLGLNIQAIGQRAAMQLNPTGQAPQTADGGQVPASETPRTDRKPGGAPALGAAPTTGGGV